MNVYSKLPEILKNNAYTTLEPLEYLLEDKVGYIKFCFSNNLTDAQFKRVTKDQELIKAIQEHISALNNQIDYLIKELETMRLMASNAILESNKHRDENLKLLVMAAREKLNDFNLEVA